MREVTGGKSPLPQRDGTLARFAARHFNALVYAIGFASYALGVWLHLPYSGGHIYSDLIAVFQGRECPGAPCTLPIPYVQSFIEYPVIVAMFIYSMGVMGQHIPGALLTNYYLVTTAVLAIPTLLLLREMIIITEMREVPKTRIFWYLILTPTFFFTLLVNWYVIGAYFAVSGIRRFLQGSRVTSGFLLGLSAASNLVTAVPALGLLISSKKRSEALLFVMASVGTYVALNIPLIIVNRVLWLQSFQFVYNWYIEDSWMLAVLANTSPIRHDIPPLIFGAAIVVMLWFRFRRKTSDPIVFAFVSMFAYAFSSYIYTPQLNISLLPFFVLIPIANSYWEFLTFDLANSMIIILGFSEALLPFGITYNLHPFDRTSVVFWIEVIRSLWVGKFTILDGMANLLPAAWRRTPPTKSGTLGELSRQPVTT